MKPKSSSATVKRVVGLSVFSAMAFAVTFVFRIPVSFLTFDLKDAVITVAAFVYGPTGALIMSAVSALLEFLTVSSTGLYGLLMNFLSSAAFSAIASLIYRKHRTAKGALLSLGGAVVAVTSAMMLFNIFVTPHYIGQPAETVIGLIPALLLPFNLAKAVLNASVVIFLYKPLSAVLRRCGLATSDGVAQPWKWNKKSTFMAVIAGVALLLSVTALILLSIANRH